MSPNSQHHTYTSAESELVEDLILGWSVTTGGHPKYWLGYPNRENPHLSDDLVTVGADTMAGHTVIIAQSGAGKSFFLGRLLEELLIRTKSRCLVLDPNADFWKAHRIKPEEIWKNASYDAAEGRGVLPHEKSRDVFESDWNRVTKRILTARKVRGSEPEYDDLRVWWQLLSVEFIAEGIHPTLRSELYHCHRFVQAIGELIEIRRRSSQESDSTNVLGAAEELLNDWYSIVGTDPSKAHIARDAFLKNVEEKFGTAARSRVKIGGARRITIPRILWDVIVATRPGRPVERALAAIQYISEDTKRFYFAKAREYETGRFVTMEPPPESLSQTRLEVIDLPSLPDKNSRFLVINAILQTEWDRARREWRSALDREPELDIRVPTFIVLDEAHNLIPSEPQDTREKALREQFRTIVAEGRKYGLFLILASQRPEKLDPIVISECHNKALMRINTESVLDLAQTSLGLEDIPPRLLRKSLEFGVGRVLITGQWAPEGPELLYGAARRTEEGGRNIQSKHWARPSDRVISINEGSISELQELPGVGPSLARTISQHRRKNGKFRSIEELLEVPGIGERRLAEIKHLITT